MSDTQILKCTDTLHVWPAGATRVCICGQTARELAAFTPAAVPASHFQFLQPPQTQPCPLVHPMDQMKWCGACLMREYEPERFAREVAALAPVAASQELSDAALLALWHATYTP